MRPLSFLSLVCCFLYQLTQFSLAADSVRLKGCEGEVAALVDERWRSITSDWENYDDDMPLEERHQMVVEDD